MAKLPTEKDVKAWAAEKRPHKDLGDEDLAKGIREASRELNALLDEARKRNIRVEMQRLGENWTPGRITAERTL